MRIKSLVLAGVVSIFSNANCQHYSAFLYDKRMKSTTDSQTVFQVSFVIKNNSTRNQSLRIMSCSINDNFVIESDISARIEPPACTKNAATIISIPPGDQLKFPLKIIFQTSAISKDSKLRIGFQECFSPKEIERNFSQSDAKSNSHKSADAGMVQSELKKKYINTNPDETIWTAYSLIDSSLQNEIH